MQKTYKTNPQQQQQQQLACKSTTTQKESSEKKLFEKNILKSEWQKHLEYLFLIALV